MFEIGGAGYRLYEATSGTRRHDIIDGKCADETSYIKCREGECGEGECAQRCWQ